MTDGNSAERERFEKWCRQKNFGTTRQPEGERFADYMSLVTERSWQAWQARAALSQSEWDEGYKEGYDDGVIIEQRKAASKESP
jgi:hypothetical protein